MHICTYNAIWCHLSWPWLFRLGVCRVFGVKSLYKRMMITYTLDPWELIHWIPENNFIEIWSQNTVFYHQEGEFKNSVWKMAIILSLSVLITCISRYPVMVDNTNIYTRIDRVSAPALQSIKSIFEYLFSCPCLLAKPALPILLVEKIPT